MPKGVISDPTDLMSPEESARFWALTRRRGECWLWTGPDNGSGFGRHRVAMRTQSVARLAYREQIGRIPDGLFVVPRCGVRLCVRPDHLQAITRAQVRQHLSGPRPDNATGYRGVSRRRGGWAAQVWRDRRILRLGHYDDPVEAAWAARIARQEIFVYSPSEAELPELAPERLAALRADVTRRLTEAGLIAEPHPAT